MNTFEPFYDRIVVKPIEPETTSKGGILLVNTAKDENRGTVVAVGHGYRIEHGGMDLGNGTKATVTQPLMVQKGDIVLYEKYGATEITIDGEKLFVMREDGVVGRFKHV